MITTILLAALFTGLVVALGVLIIGIELTRGGDDL